MNNVNIYPTAWKGRHPRPETVRRWVGQRLACEKIQNKLAAPRPVHRSFFSRLFPVRVLEQLMLLSKSKHRTALPKLTAARAKARMRNRLASQSRRNNRGR